MNQNPGTLIFMLSCHKPPLYQAGSFGARSIIAPPVSAGTFSAKIPCGPSTALMISFSGRCLNACDQSTGGNCCDRSTDFDTRTPSSCAVVCGTLGRPSYR